MPLNFEQQSVVEELSRNVLLLASAGTGKTDTLARRIVNIIKSGKAEPSEILCITFTNKACREMRDRIEKSVGIAAKEITVKTFHSFCFDIVKEYAKKRTDLFSDFTVFDEEDCKNIIKQITEDRASVDNYVNFIDYVKLERAGRNNFSGDIRMDYKNTLDTIIINNDEKLREICSKKGSLDSALYNRIKSHGHEIILSYQEKLRDNHGVDFDDLIVMTRELFMDPKIADAVGSRFKYINIDEVQDTSALEYSIIEKIFGSSNILICGDIFQTIYSWRGSNPKHIFKKFIEKYNPRKIVFKKNYRATRNLTESSIEYLNNAFPKESMKLYREGIEAESADAGKKICIEPCEDIYDEARYVYEEIKKLEKSRCDVGKTCVLTRANNYNVELSRNLKSIMSREADNFEFVLVDQFKFFRRQEIKDITAFMKLIVNRYDSLSLRRITKRLPTNIGDVTLKEIESEEYRKAGIVLSDFIDPLVTSGCEKYTLLINEFQNDNIIVFDVESTGVDVTEDEIVQIAAIKLDRRGREIGRFERFLRNTKSVASSEHVHGFSDEFLKNNGEDRKKVLLDFKEYSKGAVIVGHNVQYDINIFTSELLRHGLGKPEFKAFYDTLDIYRRFYPNMKNHKLDTLSSVFGTNHKPSHNAMDDIIATGELLVHAINKDIIPTSLSRISYMGKHMKSFKELSEKLNNLFNECDGLRPADVVSKIVIDFNLKSLYAENIKYPEAEEYSKDITTGREKISRMRDFYSLVNELDDKSKNSRDALIDIVKITGLSNGELESLIVNRTKKPRIPIITVHQAKGLEYDNVFLCGIQDNVFPSYRALMENKLEEEKRTFYVAITRAKKRLYISYCTHNFYGRRQTRSSFLDYLPDEYIDDEAKIVN